MHNDRRNDRKSVWYPGWIAVPDEPLRPCLIEDASDGGAKLIIPDVEQVPRHIKLLLSPTARTHRQCEVVWRKIGAIGVRYLSAAKNTHSTELVV
jgi:hypothetical protein